MNNTRRIELIQITISFFMTVFTLWAMVRLLQLKHGNQPLTNLTQQHVVLHTGRSSPFSAKPSAGPVPLRIAFFTVNSGPEYRIDFGDGQTAPIPACSLPKTPTSRTSYSNCPPPGAWHTYQSPGTFTATLTSSNIILSSVIITVTATSSD